MRHNRAGPLLFLASLALLALAAPARGTAQCLLCDPAPPREGAQGNGQTAEMPLRVEVTADLDFSRLVAGRGGGSVTLQPGGGAGIVGGSVASVGGYGFSGRVDVSGTPGRTVRILLPDSIALTSSSGRIARVSGISDGLPPIARLGPDGRLSFSFGGRLEVDGEAEGDYRGRIPVTISYE